MEKPRHYWRSRQAIYSEKEAAMAASVWNLSVEDCQRALDALILEADATLAALPPRPSLASTSVWEKTHILARAYGYRAWMIHARDNAQYADLALCRGRELLGKLHQAVEAWGDCWGGEYHDPNIHSPPGYSFGGYFPKEVVRQECLTACGPCSAPPV